MQISFRNDCLSTFKFGLFACDSRERRITLCCGPNHKIGDALRVHLGSDGGKEIRLGSWVGGTSNAG